MKTPLLTIPAAAVAALLLVSCATQTTTDPQSPATAATGVTRYTKETCLVTGNRLGSMGAPITKVYGNQEVKFCCQPCVAQFEKDPQRYLAKL